MALGHFFMAFPSDIFFYAALGLLIIGNGFFKPNISTLVGSLYEEGDLKRDGGFTIFYMGINLGAMIAPLFCGYLGETYGWHYGFGAAGIGMLAGLVVFWKGITSGVMGEKGLQPQKYIQKKVAGFSIQNLIYILGFVSVPIFAYLIILDTQSEVLGSALSIIGLAVLLYVGYIVYDFKIKQKDHQSGDRLIAIMILAVFCTIFWACFEQAGSSITVWVDKCVNLIGMTASQTNAINPFYIVLLAIPFSWMWTKLGALNKNPNTPIKFSLGLLQLALGFVIFGLSIHFLNSESQVPFLFVFLGYLLITTGELFLSPIGLSKVTQLAPKKIVAFMMGVWFLSSTFAHYISGGIAKMTSEPFYNEGALFVVKNGDKTESYMFDFKFDYNNNLNNIKMPSLHEKAKSLKIKKEDVKAFCDSLFTPKDKQEISKIIAYKLIQNENDFWWELDNKGRLSLSLKSEKENSQINNEDAAYIAKIKNSFANGTVIKKEIKENKNIFEKIAEIFPWDLLSTDKSVSVNEKYMSPQFNELKDSTSFIFLSYSTNESIKNRNDAIAGIAYISDKDVNISWESKKSLSPGVYTQSIISSDKNIEFEHVYKIQEGPSDLLSKTTNTLLGSPVIDKKPIATLLQYNIVYLKIGIVTIIISLFVFLISPFIKKLMHGIH
jgi:amino acid/peptide:H+ symporter